MSHSYICCAMHCVFSAKERKPWINPELRERLFPYFGGIAKSNRVNYPALKGGAFREMRGIASPLPPLRIHPHHKWRGILRFFHKYGESIKHNLLEVNKDGIFIALNRILGIFVV